jgi:hypothetical protein
MPIQFIAGSFKGVALDRQPDIYRMLHVCFDRGYLFEVDELEKIWLGAHEFKWAALPEKDYDVWFVIEKTLAPEITGVIAV